MLAESYLRTRARMALYLAAAILLLFMALQNVRYGLYDLFYMSLLLTPVMLVGAVYAWSRRSDLNAHRGHLVILIFTLAIILLQLAMGEFAIHHWLYGLALFSFLLLPLKSAVIFNLGALLAASLTFLLSFPFYDMLKFSASFTLLSGLAAVYAYLYHHKTRFLVEISTKDPTTGAYNLKHLDFTLKQEISRSETTGNPLSLIVMEIDFFDHQLEVHGPNFANELLAEFGERLLDATRAGDSIYYADRGRFFILLPVTPVEGLLVIAERLRRSVEEHTWPVVDTLTVSVGCLTRHDGETDDKALVERGIKALKQAQTSGRNKVMLSKAP